jgi:hypothetical protein
MLQDGKLKTALERFDVAKRDVSKAFETGVVDALTLEY